MHDHAPRLERLDAVLQSLAALLGCRVRIWRLSRGRLHPVVGCDGVTPPSVRSGPAGHLEPTDPDRLLAPVPDHRRYWYEIAEPSADVASTKLKLEPLVRGLLAGEREALDLAKLLAARYEEIELLYSITETLGRTIDLDEAAQKIVEAVASVVGARRASIFVWDGECRALRAVAGIGRAFRDLEPVPLDAPDSIAARVFREAQAHGYDPRSPEKGTRGEAMGRGYQSSAFLSVPLVYPIPGGGQRPVGVINLTDRVGADGFSGGERRLVQAAASQIAVAIENARLVAREREEARLRHELDLAHDLQLKLMPSLDSLGPGIDVGARCQQADRVGGDFYHVLRLPGGRIGVMLGDVSSHGFSAALIMALVMSAAGIHAEEATTADAALRRLLNSIESELAEVEMFVTLFYAVADTRSGVLRFANAGHPHAFRLSAGGQRRRLPATCPPLGTADDSAIASDQTAWVGDTDVLVLFSDGIAEAPNSEGEPFGEDRVLALVEQARDEPAARIVDRVMGAVADFSPVPADDRTLLVLRA